MIHCIRLERQIKQTLLVVDDIGHAPILTIFFTFHGLVSKDWLSHLFVSGAYSRHKISLFGFKFY